MPEKKILPVSIIITLRNEEASVREFMDSLLNQSCQPEEIVIADGCSTDATCQIIREEYQVRFPGLILIEVPGNIAKGRNQAILKAHQDIIAVTDAGCRVAPDWLEKLTAPLLQEASCDVAGGATVPHSQNLIQKAAGGFLTVGVDKLKASPLLISSRNISFKKSYWEKAGGYPENLDLSGEDTLFDKLLAEAGAKIQIVPEAIVYWSPPGTSAIILNKIFKYSKGNAQAGVYQQTILKMVLAYLILLCLLIAGFWLPVLAIAAILGYLVMLFYSGIKLAASQKDWRMIFAGAYVKGILDIANMSGYLAGLLNPRPLKRGGE